MSVKSERAIFENLHRHMILEGDDKSVEFTEIMDIYEAVTGSRYLNDRSTVPKTRALVDILMQFKVLARCDQVWFIRLIELINNSRNKQSPIDKAVLEMGHLFKEWQC